MDWNNEVALVTGATSGIGDAIAKKFVAQGMRVAVCGRRQERLDALKDEVGDALSTYQCNMRQESDILAMFDAIRSDHGGVRVLINNAGLGHRAPLLSGDTDHWREMLEVNVLALCVATREAVKDMRAQGDWGQIVHISSMAAHRVPGPFGLYPGTKYAVRALTESLRLELREEGSKVRIASISPGVVETEFLDRFVGGVANVRERLGHFPLLQPENVAEAVWYTMSQPEHVSVQDVLMRPTEQPR